MLDLLHFHDSFFGSFYSNTHYSPTANRLHSPSICLPLKGRRVCKLFFLTRLVHHTVGLLLNFKQGSFEYHYWVVHYDPTLNGNDIFRQVKSTYCICMANKVKAKFKMSSTSVKKKKNKNDLQCILYTLFASHLWSQYLHSSCRRMRVAFND